jgi:hypothetical protein
MWSQTPCKLFFFLAGLAQMLNYYSGNDEGSGSKLLNNVASSMMVTREDIKRCKSEALRSVRVPQNVIQMITDLRTYLQVGRATFIWQRKIN